MFWKLEQTGGLDVVRVHTTVYIVTFMADLEVLSWSLLLEYAPIRQVSLTVNMVEDTCQSARHVPGR